LISVISINFRNLANLKFYASNYKLNITFAALNTHLYESDLDNTAPHSIKCIYDIRLVRSPQAAGNENIVKLAADRGDPFFLGSRIP
jgi:hypothetical protein